MLQWVLKIRCTNYNFCITLGLNIYLLSVSTHNFTQSECFVSAWIMRHAVTPPRSLSSCWHKKSRNFLFGTILSGTKTKGTSQQISSPPNITGPSHSSAGCSSYVFFNFVALLCILRPFSNSFFAVAIMGAWKVFLSKSEFSQGKP